MPEKPEPRRIIRRLSLGVTVKDAKELRASTKTLTEFIKRIDHDHGPFDVEVGVSVGVSPAPAQSRKSLEDQIIEVIYVDGPEDDDGEVG